MKLPASILLIALMRALATRAPAQQASRTDHLQGAYVLDTTGLAPLPFYRPALIPGEGTILQSAGFTLDAGSRFHGEIVAVYTDSGSAEVHITGVGTWEVQGDSLILNCRWSHSLWKKAWDIRSTGVVTPSGITMRKLWHLDASLFHREGPLRFVRSP
jgi:hypothetical protein